MHTSSWVAVLAQALTPSSAQQHHPCLTHCLGSKPHHYFHLSLSKHTGCVCQLLGMHHEQKAFRLDDYRTCINVECSACSRHLYLWAQSNITVCIFHCLVVQHVHASCLACIIPQEPYVYSATSQCISTACLTESLLSRVVHQQDSHVHAAAFPR